MLHIQSASLLINVFVLVYLYLAFGIGELSFLMLSSGSYRKKVKFYQQPLDTWGPSTAGLRSGNLDELWPDLKIVQESLQRSFESESSVDIKRQYDVYQWL